MRYESVLQKAGDAQREELCILKKAVDETREKYSQSPTAGNQKNWNAAVSGLEAAMERIERAHTEPSVPHVLALVDQLKSDGYKISKSKAYQDRKKGLLRVQPDGSILATDARAYAMILERIGKASMDMESLQGEKAKKEIEKLNVQVEKIKFELERERGKYLLQEDFTMEMAARAAVLDIGLRHMFHTRVHEWIMMCGGNEVKAGLLLDSMNDVLDGLLNDFASMDRFQVVFLTE